MSRLAVAVSHQTLYATGDVLLGVEVVPVAQTEDAVAGAAEAALGDHQLHRRGARELVEVQSEAAVGALDPLTRT